MCPPPRNPFNQHPLPMQAARRLQQTGDLLQASFAFEAAALVRHTCWKTPIPERAKVGPALLGPCSQPFGVSRQASTNRYHRSTAALCQSLCHRGARTTLISWTLLDACCKLQHSECWTDQNQATLPRCILTATRAMSLLYPPQRTSCAHPFWHGRAGIWKWLEKVRGHAGVHQDICEACLAADL